MALYYGLQQEICHHGRQRRMVRQHQSFELRRISGKHDAVGQQQYCAGAPRNKGRIGIMKLTDLKKQLNEMDKIELVALICKLYKGSKQAQSIIDIEMCGASAEEQLVTDCKKKIEAVFFGSKLSLKNARTVISDFRKASQSKENVAELMLFYVECGVKFTNMYGDIDEAFYYSIESMFSDFVCLINTFDGSDYYDRNSARIKKACRDSDGIGWGFNEKMMNLYYEIEWREAEE